MRKRIMLGCWALSLALAVGASAGTLYRWTNAEGVVSYSDDPKRIPEAYREAAVPVQGSSLAAYKRYTPAPAAESKNYRERLDAHVSRMRALNEEIAAAEAAAAPAPEKSPLGEVRVNRKLALALPEGVQGDEPIVVEEHRVRDGGTTTHVYIVRQGDRILSVMRPHTNQSSANWRDLEDVLGEE